jgi:hypothetical protein
MVLWGKAISMDLFGREAVKWLCEAAHKSLSNRLFLSHTRINFPYDYSLPINS